MINFLGAISSLLPGYIQGRRQAIADNWQDLQNYNNIQQGQLSNAFTKVTWQPRLNAFVDNVRLNNLRLLNGYMGTALQAVNFPRQVMQGQLGNMYGPAIDESNYLAQIKAYEQLFRNANSPGSLFQQMLSQNQGLNPLSSSQQGG